MKMPVMAMMKQEFRLIRFNAMRNREPQSKEDNDFGGQDKDVKLFYRFYNRASRAPRVR